jgi:predicted lipoprotein with Yx(FWY)xxD motif
MTVSLFRGRGFQGAVSRQRSNATLVMLGVAGGSLLAGCGGSGSVKNEGMARSSPSTVITKHVAAYGTILAASSGQALFVLTADPPAGSKCSGSCAAVWHPLIDNGAPPAGPGVNPSLLSTFRRPDGRMQVMYNNHALYTHAGSEPAILAVGSTSDGGIWYFVSPSGKAIEQTTSGGY